MLEQNKKNNYKLLTEIIYEYDLQSVEFYNIHIIDIENQNMPYELYLNTHMRVSINKSKIKEYILDLSGCGFILQLNSQEQYSHF